MISRPALRNLIVFAALSIIMLGAEQRGVFFGTDQTLADMRMAHTPLPSDGSVVFVAVDAASLAHVGTWPWSRSIHARLLDALTAHGARDVLFDFDFAFPADAAGDRAFEDALDRAGGFAYLPVFRQTGRVTDAHIDVSNRPLTGFADRSWPALVNVEADAEGRVRYYPMGISVGAEFVSLCRGRSFPGMSRKTRPRSRSTTGSTLAPSRSSPPQTCCAAMSQRISFRAAPLSSGPLRSNSATV